MKNTYLDHAAATPIGAEVLKAMHSVSDIYANPSGIYRSGVSAKNIIDQSRKSISSILNCNSDEIYFAGSGTESVNMALIGFVKNYIFKNKDAARVARGKENFVIPKIITTNIEHSAVIETLKYLATEKLIEIIYLKVDETGKIKVNLITVTI